MKYRELLKFARESLLFIMGFLIFVFLQQLVINFMVKKINAGEFGVLNKINEGEINTEILISGTSRALKAINPQIISQKTGMSCFNIASDGSDLGQQLPKLKWYLNKNKKPKIIIQDVSQFGGDISDKIYEPYKYLPYFSDDSLYLGLTKISSNLWLHKNIYITNLIYYNFDFYAKISQGLLYTIEKQNRYINGYLPDNSKWAGDFDIFKKKTPDGINCSLSNNYKKYLQELELLCKKQNILLILAVLPNYYRVEEIMKNADRVDRFYTQLENTNSQVIYLNFSHTEIIFHKENFYNFFHLNKYGANKFSNLLASNLVRILTRNNNHI